LNDNLEEHKEMCVTRSGEQPPLEKMVFDIFIATQKVLDLGYRRFQTGENGTYDQDLEEAASRLSPQNVVRLVTGQSVTDREGNGVKELTDSMDTYLSEEKGRKFYKIGRPIYIAIQNEAVKRLLTDKKVSADRLPNSSSAMMASRHGHYQGNLPDSIIGGLFYKPDVENKCLILTPPTLPLDLANQWNIPLLGPDNTPQVDIKIEGA
jgi:hypothetical protein